MRRPVRADAIKRFLLGGTVGALLLPLLSAGGSDEGPVQGGASPLRHLDREAGSASNMSRDDLRAETQRAIFAFLVEHASPTDWDADESTEDFWSVVYGVFFSDSVALTRALSRATDPSKREQVLQTVASRADALLRVYPISRQPCYKEQVVFMSHLATYLKLTDMAVLAGLQSRLRDLIGPDRIPLIVALKAGGNQQAAEEMSALKGAEAEHAHKLEVFWSATTHSSRNR